VGAPKTGDTTRTIEEMIALYCWLAGLAVRPGGRGEGAMIQERK
jgi:hypothetical protein